MKKFNLIHVVAMSLAFSEVVVADEMDTKHGSTSTVLNAIGVEFGAMLSLMSSNAKGMSDEAFSSFDIVASLPTVQGNWLLYVEGNSTPHTHGVSASFAEVNADVGSALDRNGKGRLQVSELHYTWQSSKGNFTVGLIDASGFLDVSDVANDETSQFIASSFVNNATIAFPDYTLGAAYHLDNAFSDWGFTAVLASSHGLGDNEDASYTELVKVGHDNKGLFAAVEGHYAVQQIALRLGVWASSADDAILADVHVAAPDNTKHNYGVYSVIDGQQNNIQWNVRLGIANDDVSAAARFASVAVEKTIGEQALGMAVAKIWVSNNLPTKTTGSKMTFADTSHIELYYRLPVVYNVSITPNIQYIKHSGFDKGIDSAMQVGIRATWHLN